MKRNAILLSLLTALFLLPGKAVYGAQNETYIED